MANSVENVFIQQFDAEVKQAYQGQMELRDCVRLKTGVVGSTHNFPYRGKGVANPSVPQAEVIPMNIQDRQNPCILTNWEAAEYSDVFNASKVNFNDKQEYVMAVAGAMGRRMDQIIINEAANATQIVAVNNESFTLDKLLTAKRIMDNLGVPRSDRYFWHDPVTLEEALKLEKVTSGDYDTLKALTTGVKDSYLGFKFKMINSGREEGGLPLDTSGAYNIRTCFCTHKQAMGLAIGIDMRTEINYVPNRKSTLINGLFSAGAKLIDPDGVVKVNMKETV
ncbi:MAG TPA: phage capsid protein [Elusimicrobiales bacterium]|nr:phage capsid protein [Elusimicrobiales bacterium]